MSPVTFLSVTCHLSVSKPCPTAVKSSSWPWGPKKSISGGGRAARASDYFPLKLFVGLILLLSIDGFQVLTDLFRTFCQIDWFSLGVGMSFQIV